MNIGFDLDRIFIDTPPFIPDWMIEKLYKAHDNGTLEYRIPGNIEQKIRKFSHLPYFRPAITENIALLKQLAALKKHKLYLISGRFGFLQQQTEKILHYYQIDKIFSAIYFNTKNEQPHLFKNRMIIQTGIEIFIDDDLSLLKFLAKRHADITFYWFNTDQNKMLNENLQAITTLTTITHYANN